MHPPISANDTRFRTYIPCSRSREPVMKYGSLLALMSRVAVGNSLAGLGHCRDGCSFPIISCWEQSANRLKRLLSCAGMPKLSEWFLLFLVTNGPQLRRRPRLALRMAERCNKGSIRLITCDGRLWSRLRACDFCRSFYVAQVISEHEP
jgi:hypothetical protein